MSRNHFHRAAKKNYGAPAAPGNDNAPIKDAPRWDFADLYPGLESAEIEADKNKLEERVSAFEGHYQGTAAYMRGEDLGAAIAEYEEISSLMTKISTYVELVEVQDIRNFSRTEKIKGELAEIAGKLSFFEAELIDIPQKDLLTKMSAPELARYAPWLGALREANSYSMPQALVQLSGDFQTANTQAWQRLYREMLEAQRVDFKGQRLTLDEADALILSDASSAEDRDALRQAVADQLKKQGKKATLIYNTIIKDAAIENKLYGYMRPDQSVNIENGIDPAILDTMKKTLKEHYSTQSHRFYAWIAKQRGQESIGAVETNLPAQSATPTTYSFDEARKLVLRAFNKFSPKFSRIAQKIFNKGHVDAAPREGKETGAFAQPVSDGILPFIMLSYTGDLRDVVILGHEMGHGIHQTMSQERQGFFMSDVSTPVAETASVFAEMLVFDEILKKEKDPAAKKRLLADKVENMLSNSLQQLSYYEFECRVHKEREHGEVPFEKISDIWIDVQKEYFGPAVAFDDYSRYSWMTVPHFFETPFYVYSYAFAQVLVSSLYQAYKKADETSPAAREEFIESYIELLQTGSTRTLHDMFWPFELDLQTPDFWRSGMSLTDKYMQELFALDAPAPGKAKKPPAPKNPS